MLEWLRRRAQRVEEHTDDVEEHEAFVELLVAAMFADQRVTQHELDAIEAFDASHADWNAGAFSVGQYFGPAAAKVRQASSDGAIPQLVNDIATRLHGPEVRSEAIAACEDLLRHDGMAAEEQVFLDAVATALH